MVTMHAADVTTYGWSEATLMLDVLLMVLGVATFVVVRRLLGGRFAPILTISVGGGLLLISQVHLLETILAYQDFVGTGAPEGIHRLLVALGFLWVIAGIGLSSKELVKFQERLERQAAGEAAERAKTQAVLDNMADGVLVADGAGRMLDANPALCALLGVPPDGMRGRVAGEFLFRIQAPEAPFVPATSDVGTSVSLTIPGRDQRLLLSAAVSLLSEASEPLHAMYVVVLRDASQQYRLDRMKTEFVEMVSHELRRPVTNLALAAELHRDYTSGLPVDDPARRIGEILLQESGHARALVEDILTSASFEAGQLRMSSDPVALLPIVLDVASAFGQDQQDGRLAVTDVTRQRVAADPLAIRLVLHNLIDNALKYSPPGDAVEVSMWERDDEVGIEVKDHGEGIPAGELKSIFDRFHRLDNRDSRTTYGFGLGLYIAQRVTEAIGGRLVVESTPGAGSAFTLVLPLFRPAPASAGLVEV